MYISLSFHVHDIGVSLVSEISSAKWVFGAGKCTTWPSSISNKSCHGMTCGDHRKSFKKIHSAFWTPTQAKLPEAGLQKVSKIKVNGLRKKVFPQFACPVSIMFRYLPLPCIGTSHTGSQNTFSGTWLLARISSAQIIRSPSHPSVHSSSFGSCNNSWRVFLDCASFYAAFLISHTVFNISATALGMRLTRNLRRSVFPSFFCWW